MKIETAIPMPNQITNLLRRFLRAAALLVLASQLSACGEEMRAAGSGGTIRPFSNDGLIGAWSPGCLPSTTDNTKSVLELQEFSETTVKASGIYYRDTLPGRYCKTEYSRLSYIYKYSVGGPSPYVVGAMDLILEFTGGEFTPITAEAAKAFNDANYCGFSDWTAGKMKQITKAADCMDDFPAQWVDMAYLNKGELFFGDISQNQYPPVQLNLSQIFKRK